MSRQLTLKDLSFGNLFRGQRKQFCARMTNEVDQLLVDYAGSIKASKSDVIAISLGYYLHDLVQEDVTLPAERLDVVQVIKGKKKNVMIHMTDFMYDLLNRHSMHLNIGKSDLITMGFLSYMYGEDKVMAEMGTKLVGG